MVEFHTYGKTAEQQLEEDSPAIIERFRTEYDYYRVPGVPYPFGHHVPKLEYIPILSAFPKQWSCKVRWVISGRPESHPDGPQEEIRGERDFKLAIVDFNYIFEFSQDSSSDSQHQQQTLVPRKYPAVVGHCTGSSDSQGSCQCLSCCTTPQSSPDDVHTQVQSSHPGTGGAS